MENVEIKFDQLKHTLESAAFLSTSKTAARRVHAEIVQGLIILSELREACLVKEGNQKVLQSDVKEINKVSRRLKLWAKRQNQINSRILNAYLKLERSGISVITEADVKNELSPVDAFDTNFVQMKIVAEKNHGKIFQQYGERITLWEPIISKVREYEDIVFSEK